MLPRFGSPLRPRGPVCSRFSLSCLSSVLALSLLSPSSCREWEFIYLWVSRSCPRSYKHNLLVQATQEANRMTKRSQIESMQNSTTSFSINRRAHPFTQDEPKFIESSDSKNKNNLKKFEAAAREAITRIIPEAAAAANSVLNLCRTVTVT